MVGFVLLLIPRVFSSLDLGLPVSWAEECVGILYVARYSWANKVDEVLCTQRLPRPYAYKHLHFDTERLTKAWLLGMETNNKTTR